MPDIVNSSVAFFAWWQTRKPLQHDRRLKQLAIEADLVVQAGDMLFLTEAGKEHRNACIPPRRRKSRA